MKHALLALLAIALATLSTRPAEADPWPRTFAHGRPTIMLGAFAGGGVGSHHAHEPGPAWALHGDVFVHPWFTVGLIGGMAVARGNDGERLEVRQVHARATLRPLSRWVIDPWIAAETGYTGMRAGQGYDTLTTLTDRAQGLGFGVGIGVEAVLARRVGAGVNLRQLWGPQGSTLTSANFGLNVRF